MADRISIKGVSDHQRGVFIYTGVEHPAHTVTHGQKSLYLKDFSFNRIMLIWKDKPSPMSEKAITDFLHNLSFWLYTMFKI